jgi:hypothetical protein
MMLTFYSLPWSPSRQRPFSGTSNLIAALLLALVASPVLAQSKPDAPKASVQPKAAAAPSHAMPTAVLLATAGGHASARALDSVISAALDELKAVNVVARPGMDLGAVQLALDCVAETPQCLRIVTTQHEADVLVAPTLARISNELVLTLLRFDARTGKTQRVLKRQPGQTLGSDTLDAVPDLLRELFGLPPKEKAPPAVAVAPSEAKTPETDPKTSFTEPMPEPPMEAPSTGRKVPLGPILLGSGGVVLLGAGLVMGITVMNAEDKYKTLTADTSALDEDGVDQAIDYRDTGERNAVITNVFLGLGSAVVIAAGIWLAVDLSDRGSRYEDHVQLTPLIGRNELGLMLTHRGAGL